MQTLREATNAPADCALALVDLVPLVMRTLRAEFQRHRGRDLSVPQFRVLAFLEGQPGAGLSAVAQYIGLTVPGASRLVDSLVARGLVARRVSPKDRRCVRLALTPPGRALLRSAREGAQVHVARVLEGLSAEQRDTVLKAAAILRPIFGQAERAAT